MTDVSPINFHVFFDGKYNLELEPSLTKVWAIESPESSSPLLKAMGSISSIFLRAPEFPKKKKNRKHTKLVCLIFFGFPNWESG